LSWLFLFQTHAKEMIGGIATLRAMIIISGIPIRIFYRKIVFVDLQFINSNCK